MTQANVDTCIVGAGLAGLAAALSTSTSSKTMVLEKKSFVGGAASSEVLDGYTFDVTGHFLHLKHPESWTLVHRILGKDGLLEIPRQSAIHMHGMQTPYPFQAHTYGMPPSVVADCLLGYLRARVLQADPNRSAPIETFEDFIRLRMGDGIADHFMIPYNQKLWTVHPSQMRYDWCKQFVPLPNDEEVVLGALFPQGAGKSLGYNKTFFYPKDGGIGALAQGMAQELAHPIHFNTQVRKILWQQKVLVLASGERVAYKRLISTIPLPELCDRMDPVIPSLMEARKNLRATSVTYWNIGLKGARTDPHWMYFPEKKFPFYRVGAPSSIASHLAPQGCRSLYVEVAHPHATPCPADDDAVIAGLVEAKLIEPKTSFEVFAKRCIPYAYAIPDAAYESSRASILETCTQHDIHSIGRWGGWRYDSMEGAFTEGRLVGAQVGV